MLTLLSLLYDPTPVFTFLSLFFAQCTRNWINGLWHACRVFWADLDVTTLDVSVDVKEFVEQLLGDYQSSGLPFAMYVAKLIFFSYLYAYYMYC